MNKENEKYMPIGSVVRLKNGKRRIMVTGYVCIDMENNAKVYDYCGCVYPIGVINSKQSLLFNHEDIEEVSAVGYKDEEGKKFLEELKKNITEENIKKMIEEARKQSGE